MPDMKHPHAHLTLERALANIARDNARLNAILDLSANPAGDVRPDGELAGFPVAVKSNIAVQGLPFTAGIGAFRDRIASTDAAAVERLREAGAVIVGSANMEEAAIGAVTDNPHFGRTHNPRRFGFTPGGSSGGSAAAIAAGFSRVALGTDTMGSCRIPAAYCGVVGFKPSVGRISARGVEPLSRRLDHVGILAANVADIRAVADVLCRFDPSFAWSIDYPPLACAATLPLNQCRFGVLNETAIAGLPANVAMPYLQAILRLRGLGAVTVAQPVDQSMLGAARRAGLLWCEAELVISLATEYSRADGGLSPSLRAMIAFAEKKGAPDLARANGILDSMVLFERMLFENVDAILWPTAPQTAFAFDTPIPTNQADFTCLANFTGAPALSLPLPVANGELPAGLQIMLPRGSDGQLLDMSAGIEQMLNTSSS